VRELKDKEKRELEKQSEAVVSLSNTVNELFKHIERSQRKEKPQSVLKDTTVSKKNATLEFGTPVSRISNRISKFDENRSPIRFDDEPQQYSMVSQKRDKSSLLSKFEAVQKMAHDILDDDDL
jgi:hypothetical protein